MKIRTGFVSNSSSSSFVLVGVKVAEDVVSLEELCRRLGLDDDDPRDSLCDSDHSVLYGSDDGVEDGYIYLGEMLAEGEYSLDSGEADLKRLFGEAEMLRKRIGSGESVVVAGTRGC